ncbi:MAG: T9SS type A sorting domain-containing protein [Ignavibacteria bacterium]|nr:T9SS type A sorting domain-containing protein [Ignavibacteria bacterium]
MVRKIFFVLYFLCLASFISIAAEPPKYDTLKIDVEDKRFSIPVDYCHNKEDKTVFIAGVAQDMPDIGKVVSNLNFFKLNYKNGNIQYEWQKRYETAKFIDGKIEGFNFHHNCKGVMYCNEEEGFNLFCSMENKYKQVPTIFSFDANGNLLYENKDTDSLRFANEHFCAAGEYPVYILNADKSVYSIFKNYNLSKNTTYPKDLVYIHTDAQGNFIAKERIIDYLDKSVFPQIPNFFSMGRFHIKNKEDLVYDKDSNMYVLATLRYTVSESGDGDDLIGAGPEMILLKFDKNFKLQWSKFGHELVNSSLPTYTSDTLCGSVSNIDFTQDGNLLIIVQIYSKEAKQETARHILKLSSSTGEVIERSPSLEEISEYLSNINSISYNTDIDDNMYLYTTFNHYFPEYDIERFKYCVIKLNPNLKDIEWILKDDKHLIDLDTSCSSLKQFIELEPGHLLFTGQISNKRVIDLIDSSKVEKPMFFFLEIFDNKGIAEPIALERFISYPNPVSDKFTVQANFLTFVSNVSISVIDITGRVVKQVFFGSSISGEFSYTFSTSDLSNGVYNVVLSFDGKEQSEKLIINR